MQFNSLEESSVCVKQQSEIDRFRKLIGPVTEMRLNVGCEHLTSARELVVTHWTYFTNEVHVDVNSPVVGRRLRREFHAA
jgi:hypothetical protein